MMGRPGSVPWLLRHELRLTWRRYDFGGRKVSGAVLVMFATAAAQLVGFAVAGMLQGSTAVLADRLAVANAILLVVGGIMLSYALDAIVAALFERRDLDWLLASPVPFRRVLAVRIMGVAIAVSAPWLLLLGPVANAMAVLGQPGWLAAYPVLGILAVLATVPGMVLGIGMVSAFGLRRARRVISIVGMVVGALVVLASQLGPMLSPRMQSVLWQALTPACCGLPAGMAWWPARALLGEPLPFVALLLLAAAAALAAGWAMERRFVAGAAFAPPSGRSVTHAGGRAIDPGRFRRGTFGVLLRKELRLLRRTPNLLSRAAYQLVYLMPPAAVLWSGNAATGGLGVGTVAVMVAGETARLLISAAANADDAAELSQTAPLLPGVVRAAKMAAAGLGVAAILTPPLVIVAIWHLSVVPALMGGVVCVTASGLLMGVWRAMPVRRTDLGGTRAGSSSGFLFGFLVSVAWSASTGLAMAGNPWAVLPAAFALGGLAIAWSLSRPS